MSLVFKRLEIEPLGNITGGYLQYSLDPDGGNISYQGEVTAKVWFFSKTVPLNGISKVDPAVLKYANIVVGKAFDFGNLKIMVTEVKDGKAKTDVVLSGDLVGSGHAVFDLSAEVIALMDVQISASVPVIGSQTLHAMVLK